MNKNRVNKNNRRGRVNQQAIANHLNRKIVGKPGSPDDHPGHQQHKNHAHNGPEHHFLPGVIFPYPRHFMLVAFQHLNNPLEPGNILPVRNIVVDKAYKHKHQGHENQHAEERMQNTPHLRRTEGFGQPLQRREEKRDPR